MKKWFLLCAAAVAAMSIQAADLLADLTPGRLQKEVGDVKLIKVDGKNAIELTGVTGKKATSNNLYLNFSLRLAQPISLEGKTLQVKAFSKSPTPGFYVRAYNAGDKKAAWSHLSWNKRIGSAETTVNVTGGRSDLLQWEPAMTSGGKADKIDRIQFYIGSPEGETPFDLVITGLQDVAELPPDKVPAGGSSAAKSALAKVVELPKNTALVKNGVANAEILHPASDAGRAAAAKVAAAVKAATGVELPARPGAYEDYKSDKNLIILGNIFTNPALKVLYSRKQTNVDGFLPGPGGWTVESILEAVNRNADVIVLGASDDAGLARAADEFANRVKTAAKDKTLDFPLTFAYEYTADIAKDNTTKDHVEKNISTAHQRLRDGTHTALGGQLASIGDRYRLFRNSADAKSYLEVAKIYAESAKSDPRKFGGAWGFDSDFPSYEALTAWDLIEHDPALSSEDRLVISNVLLRWLDEAIYAEAKGGSNVIGPVSNHLTFCSMGTMAGGLYFSKYYAKELPQTATWLKTVNHVFRNQGSFGKVHDDCDSYQWLTWRHLLVYTMAMPDDLILKNGVGKRMVDIVGITMDNLGTQAPYGDDSGWRSSGGDVIVLEMYHAATRDPISAALLKIKRDDGAKPRIGGFWGPIDPKPTTVFDGLKVLSMDPGFYKHTKNFGKIPPLERSYDKFSFRDKLERQALYLLVDGINNGGHRHADANSVLRFTQFGREWLAENEYIKNQQKYHNSLLLLFEGEAYQLPDYMEVVDSADGDDFGYFVSRANGVGPADWIRYFIWLKKDQAWLLIDEVLPAKDGVFRLTQRWNGIGERTDRPDGYELTQQDGVAMRIQTTGDIPLSTYDNADLGKQWASYPYAKPVIRVIDQTLEGAQKAGAKVQMAALWHGSAKSPAPEWAIDRIKDGFSVDTGANSYRITTGPGGKLALSRAAEAKKVVARKASTAAAAAAAIPAAAIEWRDSRGSDGAFCLTDPAIRTALPFKLEAPAPTPNGNIFIAGAANSIEALNDGIWEDGGDSVMFKPDQKVVLTYSFAAKQTFNQVDLQLWWAASSSRGTAYKLDTMTVELSDDNFTKDIRKVGTVSASAASHPSFGKPVLFRAEFAPAAATAVRITLIPQKNTALYIGEVQLFGKVAPGVKIPAKTAVFSRVIRVKDTKHDDLAAATRDGYVFFLDNNGKETGKFRIPAAINDLAAIDLDNDGEKELLLACQDAFLRAVKRDGKELWKKKFEFYRIYPDVTIVKTADINGDGKEEILVGCDNWRTYAFDLTGKELWNYEVVHPTRAVEVADIDADGKPEIICGTRYMWATVLDNRGLKRWGSRFGVGCRAVAAPLNGRNGERNVVLGIDSGLVTFHDKAGKELESFFTGDEIFMMTPAVAKDGKQDVFISSFNGYVYRFDAAGKRRWSVALPAAVKVVKALPDGGAAAGTIDGDVAVISADGKIRSLNRFNGEITDILVDGPSLRISTDGGEIASLKL